MFLGHYGIAFAAKKAAPKVSLGVFFFAAQFADILWPTFLVSHVERFALKPGISVVSPYDFIYYPWSHSLLMDLFWGLLLGLIYYSITRSRRGAWMVGLVVVSHWLLDFVVHIQDLPLAPFSTAKFGLGGWNSIAFTIAAEAVLFFGGLFIYLKNTKPTRATGSWVLGLLVILLTLLYFGTTFSRSQESPLIVLFFVFMFLQAVVISLATWADKNRISV